MAASKILGDFAQKVAFVTGASSGIGAATAIEFARNGARVAIHGRNMERLTKTEEQCIKAGAKKEDIHKVIAEICKPDEVDACVKSVIEKFGTVNMFVSNAGCASTGGGIDGCTMDEVEKMMQLNVKGPFLFAKLLKPYLVESKGSMVFVSSDSAHLPSTTMLAYSMSKAALSMMGKCLALELAEFGVRTNIVSPCWVRTSVLQHMDICKTEEDSDKMINDNVRFMVQKYIPYPDEVGRFIVCLASPACNYLNGQDIVLDGGNTLTSLATHGWWLEIQKADKEKDGGVLAQLQS